MKTFVLKDYPNLLDHTTLTTEDILIALQHYKLQFIQIRNDEVEWKIAFPTFITPFYKFIYLNNDLIQQEEYYEYYLSENKEYFIKNPLSLEKLKALKARLFRTYPSLVRDFHFSLYLKENLKGSTIIFNGKLDVEEGIDILIEHKGEYFGINLFINSKRARLGREKKISRHDKFNNVKYQELPIEFNNNLKHGDFFLYGEEEMKLITNTIFKS